MKQTKEFWWLYGVYLGDGFITYNNQNSKVRYNILGLKTKDYDFIKKFKKNIRKVTHHNHNAKIIKAKSRNARKGHIWSYRVSTPDLCAVVVEIFPLNSQERLIKE